jgi:hypothetical protein
MSAAVEAKIVALRKEKRGMRATVQELGIGNAPFNASYLHDHPYRSKVWLEWVSGLPMRRFSVSIEEESGYVGVFVFFE